MNLKTLLLIIGLFALAAVLGVVVSSSVLRDFNIRSNSKVIVNNKTFTVTLAKTQEDQQIGLTKYKSLPKDAGMLFLFNRPDMHSFWMRNLTFPIDLIFLRDNRVVTVHQNLQPLKQNEEPKVYQPTEPANRVLEINAGLVRQYDIKKGTTVKYENISN